MKWGTRGLLDLLYSSVFELEGASGSPGRPARFTDEETAPDWDRNGPKANCHLQSKQGSGMLGEEKGGGPICLELRPGAFGPCCFGV